MTGRKGSFQEEPVKYDQRTLLINTVVKATQYIAELQLSFLNVKTSPSQSRYLIFVAKQRKGYD